MSERKDETTAPSDEFLRAFDSRTSGCRRTCDCGRTHFDVSDNGWTWEEGELERLQKLSEDKPEDYVASDGAVGSYCVDNHEFVWGCHCNKGWKVERFLIEHSEQIAKYLNLRAARLKDEAQKMEVKP